MPTSYEQIADEYQRAKAQPWRLHVEYFSLFQLIGNVSGQAVLDLACGEGFHTRFLKQHGAGRAVGVDISPRMIDLARQAESRQPLGIDYHVEDVRRLKLEETFDLVAAAYLLNYARTADELLELCQAIARHLKPGCRFITINNNPEPGAQDVDYRRYGFERLVAGPVREGTPIVWRIHLATGPFDIENYYLSPATHERAFREAGLHGVRWVPPQVSPAGLTQFGAAYWDPFLAYPPVILLECTK